MTAQPIRIQLSPKKGFNLQAHSMALNGLPAVKVDRKTKWGNPFVPGRDNPFLVGKPVVDRRHAFCLYRSFAPDNQKLVDAARSELRGKNLACWCDKPDPHEDCCHAAVLLDLANQEPSP